MQRFNSRALNWELDFCESERGWWLDRGGEKRSRALMEEWIKDRGREAPAVQERALFLKNAKSKSILQKVRSLFPG